MFFTLKISVFFNFATMFTLMAPMMPQQLCTWITISKTNKCFCFFMTLHLYLRWFEQKKPKKPI